MEEVNKSAEVDIDTDGVQEQEVNVEAPQGVMKRFQKEEVDLGYTDVTGGKTAKELLQEAKEQEAEPVKEEPKFEQKTEESDLQDYSEKVQRIRKLTFQIKEAERRKSCSRIC